ncbi:MAG TPA: hydroxymethylglutaryl-CoA lyase [bacterium]
MNPLDQAPRRVRVVEVGPRDGLQNESAVVSVDVRVQFIRGLAAAGCPVIEAGAFVRPDRIPQMANTEEVFRRLQGVEGPVFTALVPNRQGMERALRTGAREVAVFTAASEAFARHNINMGIEESLAAFREVMALAQAAGRRVRGYVSTSWWCPYSGRVAPEQVRSVARALVEMGCYEVAISDTIGAATPAEVISLLESLSRDLPASAIAVHFHDTRGTALANVLAALACGISTVDASAGGLGGCPYAPGASGNLATEDLLYMLHGMGIATGIDLEAVAAASRALAGPLGHPLPSRYLEAGRLQFPGS